MSSPGASSTLRSWKPLVICPHPAIARELRSALSELGFESVSPAQDYPRTGTMATLVAQSGSNICFLDVASQQEQALVLLSEAAAVLPVVALNPLNDADLILRCLRRGACEFVAEATAEQINGVLQRLTQLRATAEQPKLATVYGVVPGKPGCGASTLAAHLAIELKRGGAASVLLVDVDWLTGSIAFLLKLKSTFHLGDAVRDCLRLDEDLWSRMVTPCHGIDVLTAGEEPAASMAIDRPAAMELICYWREHYERVILDLPGAGMMGSDLIPLCDELLLVTTNELLALHATRRTVEWLRQSGVHPDKLKLLVTRYTPATGLKRDDVERALQMAPYALLSNDYEAVQRGVLEGKPVSSGSHFGRSVHALREQLLGTDKPAKKRGNLFGLLSRPDASVK